jgi:hypothetical protein
MQIEQIDENDCDFIEVLYPTNNQDHNGKEPNSNSLPFSSRNLAMRNAIKQFKTNSSIDVAQTLFYHQTDFNMKIRDKILSNFRSIENFSKRFFLYLIVFRPENIHELNQSFFFFEKDIPCNESGETENMFRTYRIKSASSLTEYIDELKKIKSELSELEGCDQHKIVCYFEQIFILSAADLEKLIFLINEDIVNEFPNYRFNFLINIIEKYQFNFRLKDLFVERFDFTSKNSLFFKALIKMVKASQLPSPIFSQDFLGKIHRNFKDYCGTLMVEANRWSVYKELQYVQNYEEIEKILKQEKFIIMAKEYNFKFSIGLKILKLIGKHFIGIRQDYLHEWMLNVLTSKNKIDFSLYNTACVSNFNYLTEKLLLIGEKVRLRKKNNENDACSFFTKIEEAIKEYRHLLKNGRPKEDRNLPMVHDPRNSKDFIAHMILSKPTNSNQNSASLSRVYIELNEGIRKMVFDYFEFVLMQVPELLISDFEQLSSMVNPDITGSMFEAFDKLNIVNCPLYSARILFEILKNKPTRNNAISIFEEFKHSARDFLENCNSTSTKGNKKSSNKKLKKIDLFIYNQQLFEHLKMTNLSHSNVYKLDKLYFSKFSLNNNN